MSLEVQRTYTRHEISGMLGGNIQAYLPVVDGRVVCGCFRKEEEFNADSPEEVVFGRDYVKPQAERAATIVYEQGKGGEAIPVFIRRDAAKWEYVGDYRCVGLVTDPAMLARKMAAHPRRGVIKGILLFEKA